MKKIIKFSSIIALLFILIGCGEQEPELTYSDYYEYKVTQTLNIGSETYQYGYIYDYQIQIKPNDEYSNHKEYILKFTIYDGDADDVFAEEVIIKYYSINANTNISETISNVYVNNLSLSPYKVEAVENIGQDYIKDFALDQVIITFDFNGGSTVDNQEIPRGSQATKPNDPNKDNAVFLYWSTSLSTPSEFSFSGSINQNTTLYAIYEYYTEVTFFYNDDNSPSSQQTLTIGNKISGLPTPIRTGYSFSGWYKDQNFINKVTSGVSIVEKDMILYAKWTPIEYNITYNIGDDVTNLNTINEFNIETNTFYFIDPTRPGYTFTGWYTNEYLIGDIIIGIEEGSYGYKNLYAKWEGNTYNVDLIFNDGATANQEIEVEYGEEYGELPVPNRDGYIFEGWYLENNDYNSFVTLTLGTQRYVNENNNIVSTSENHNLYARWIEGTPGLKFDLTSNGWTLIGYSGNSTEIYIPESIAGSPVSSISSYAFNGMDLITRVVVPESVESISEYAFYNLISLESITLPFIGASRGENETLGYVLGGLSSYFYGTYSYGYYPKSLKEVIITDETHIGNDAFYGAELIEVLEINDGITYIGYSAFSGMSSLLEFIIPSSVTTIGSDAFKGCTNLSIIANVNSKPTGWASDWNPDNRPVTWLS